MGNLSTLAIERRAVMEINQLHVEILKLRQNIEETALEKAIRIGALLEEEKAKLEPRKWASWVRENLEFTLRQADRYRVIVQKNREGILDSKSRINIEDAARRTAKVIDVEATVMSGGNGDSEPERGLDLGVPTQEQASRFDDKPEDVIYRKLTAWLEHRRLMPEIINDLKAYLKLAKLPRKTIKRQIKLCCLDDDKARESLESLLLP